MQVELSRFQARFSGRTLSNNNSNRVGDYLSPAANDFIAGTVSFAGKIVEHPFDTVKVLLQTQQKPQSSHKNVKSVSSAVSTATNFVRHSGSASSAAS